MNDQNTSRPVIDYQGPRPPGPPIFSVRLAISYTTVAMVTSIVFVLVLPRFEQIFKDFGTTLPAITQFLLWMSRTWTWTVVWLLPPAMGFLPVIVNPTGQPEAPRHRAIRLLIHIAVMLLMIGVIGMGLFLPYISLIYAISGGSGGQ